MNKGYVFYDTETTGINTAFDQILQFGAIRTDADLNELERFEARCRLLPYIVPTPKAMALTGVTADMLVDPSLPSHYEMISQVKAKFEEWSPTTFIGHNSMSFDELLLRQALYKNLYSPYLTNMNGNGRADSILLCHAYNALAPGTVSIPIGDNGKPSYKLDRLAPANGFDHANAHDAMGDVEATIHMCRLMKDSNPEIWSTLLGNARKSAVQETLGQSEVFLNIGVYYQRAYLNLVTPIGVNPDYKAEHLLFNLELDPDDFAALSEEELSKKLASSPKPIRSLRANAFPIIVPIEAVPDEIVRALPNVVDLREKAASIADAEGLRDGLIETYLGNREPFEPSEHVEKQMYDGFISDADQVLLDKFHAAPWEQRAEVLNQLSDGRLKTLGQRLIHSEAPDTMNDNLRHSYEVAIANRLLAEPVEDLWQTLPQAISDAESMMATAEGETLDLLRGLLVSLREQSSQLQSQQA